MYSVSVWNIKKWNDDTCGDKIGYFAKIVTVEPTELIR